MRGHIREATLGVLSSAAITESLAGGGVRGSSAEMLRPQKVLIIHHHVAKCHQTRFSMAEAFAAAIGAARFRLQDGRRRGGAAAVNPPSSVVGRSRWATRLSEFRSHDPVTLSHDQTEAGPSATCCTTTNSTSSSSPSSSSSSSSSGETYIPRTSRNLFSSCWLLQAPG